MRRADVTLHQEVPRRPGSRAATIAIRALGCPDTASFHACHMTTFVSGKPRLPRMCRKTVGPLGSQARPCTPDITFSVDSNLSDRAGRSSGSFGPVATAVFTTIRSRVLSAAIFRPRTGSGRWLGSPENQSRRTFLHRSQIQAESGGPRIAYHSPPPFPPGGNEPGLIYPVWRKSKP